MQTKFNLKDGAKFKNMDYEVMKALPKMMDIFNFFKCGDLTVTSGNDGEHMEGSKHYEGKAVDLRVWGIHDHDKRLMVLGVMKYWFFKWDIIDEGDHIHAEYDPK